MRIAFFDSGIGGLSVLHQARSEQPQHQYIYFADTDNAPYGPKPAAAVRDHTLSACDFLASLQPDALVVACNTATAVCVEALRQRYRFPVFGMEPAVKPALAQTGRDRVLVMATSLTLQETKLSALLKRVDTQGLCDKLAMDKLVTFAEQGCFEGPQVEAYIRNQLNHYDLSCYSAVVLGCTHFIYFKPVLQALLGPHVALVDGNQGTVRHMFNSLQRMRDECNSAQETELTNATPQMSFYRSGQLTAAADTYFNYLSRLEACG